MQVRANPATDDAPLPAPVNPPPLLEGAHGYLVSSLELRAGLEVTAMAVTLLPAELLREFSRLRGSWDDLPVLVA